jgi:NAD(P)-dependent dehydrogenase (short-subunit alcohol dehydrogenase family)
MSPLEVSTPVTTALITGANRGLGFAIASDLAAIGMTVIVGARDADSGRAAAEEIGRGATSVQLDVTDADSVRAAAQTVCEVHGGLDVLVNNAGILPEATDATPAEALDLEMFRQTFATNLLGPVVVLEVFLPMLRGSAAGRIVNVSSTMGSMTDQTDQGSPYYAMHLPAYRTSKAALNNVTISLAKALAQTPIKVTSVCPGFVQTDLTPINRDQAPLTAQQAAKVVVMAATLDDDAPSGTFIDGNGVVAW